MKYLILALLVAAVSAQRQYPEFDRPCSERSAIIRPQVKTAFNVAAYSGTWFEIGRYQQQNEPEADCLASHYSWNFRNSSFRIDRDGFDFNTGLMFNRDAQALLAFPEAVLADRLGLMNVTYYADREADETNYYVLATDYFQYGLIWACEDLPDSRSREFASVISRTPELPESYNERVDEIIDRFMDRTFIRNTLQTESYCLDRVQPGVRTKELYSRH